MAQLIRFGRDVLHGWMESGSITLAASLAYYAIFAIAPLLLLSIHIASLFLDRTTAVERLTNEFIGVIGPSGSEAIKQMLDVAGTAQPEGWAGLLAIALLIVAAAGFVSSLQSALDTIWHAEPVLSGVWSFVRTKLLSFSLVLAAAFLLLVSLVLSTAMAALTGRFTMLIGLRDEIVGTLVGIANFFLSAAIFTAIFKFVPAAEVSWRAAAAAALFTALLFAAGRFALAWYLGREAVRPPLCGFRMTRHRQQAKKGPIRFGNSTGLIKQSGSSWLSCPWRCAKRPGSNPMMAERT
jgi:membrane protein